MELSKPTRHGLACGVGVALALAAIALVPAVASAAGSTNVAVTVTSSQANAGSVAVTNITDTTTYGTCSAPASPGSSTCTISGVPAGSGVLLIAQPASGEMLGTWSQKCASAPGPVCHFQSGPNGKTTDAGVTLVTASGPSVSASPVYVSGPTPNSCSGAEATTVSGSGFAADSAATLSDDGNVVASGTTDDNGNVSFPYTPASSEPGIYRVFTITVGAQSAGTDVYNSGRFCITSAVVSTGMDTMTVNVSGLDANSSDTYVQVMGQAATVIDTDSTGAGSATTPAFACTAGKSFSYRLYGVRGIGTKAQYSFNTGFLRYAC